MTKSETMRAARELGLSVAEHKVDASQLTAQRTVTRVDLAEAVYRCVGLSRKESAILVESVLDELADALVGGESVVWAVSRARQVGAHWAKSQDRDRSSDNPAPRHGV
jgi:hypothetical protein